MDRKNRRFFAAGVALGVAGTLAAHYVLRQYFTPEPMAPVLGPRPAKRSPAGASRPDAPAPDGPATRLETGFPEPPLSAAALRAQAERGGHAGEVAALKRVLCAIAQKYARQYFDKELSPATFTLSLVHKNERDQFVPVTDPAHAGELYLFGVDETGCGAVREFILCYDPALKAMTCFGLRTRDDDAMVYAELLAMAKGGNA